MDLTDNDEDAQYNGSASPPTEDLVVDAAMRREIEGLIRALKEPYLQVSVLYFLEQRSVDEIAARLGRPPKTVHTQLYRANQILQQRLIKGGVTRGRV